ncbi:MAG: CDP-alcohol phosphatidyltransferase family protein [Actinomycetota bacterium]|nr:CDP-alcohol phosphatidyltransferase family protein [Actinomycetota bacterium]
MPDLPDRDGYFDRWSALHGGYDPRGAFWPRAWLTLTYRCARPLAWLGVAPDVVTCAGAVVSAAVVGLAALGGRWPLLAVVVVVLSGLVDNLDGAVAALTGRASAFGYVLDSLVDRVSDGCYLVALWLLGAPAWLCVLGGAVTMLQEYLRARAGNAGMGEIGVVTVAERPTRVIVTAFALCGAGVVPAHAGAAATLGAAAWLVVGTVGFGELCVAVRKAL